MRTRAKIASVLSSGAVLLVGWQLGTQASASSLTPASTVGKASTATPGATTPSTRTPGTPSASGSAGAAGGTATPTPAARAADGTYPGTSVMTRYGAVQVSVTISGGAITDVTALHLTDDEQRSVQISNSAAPILRKEVLSAQSGSVSTVSRATITSDAYLQSVQSALQAAGW